MNDPLNTKNGAPMLKQFYPVKRPKHPPGPIAQMNQNSPMMLALRQKRDMIGKTQIAQNPSANKIMHKPGVSPIPLGGLKQKPKKKLYG